MERTIDRITDEVTAGHLPYKFGLGGQRPKQRTLTIRSTVREFVERIDEVYREESNRG